MVKDLIKNTITALFQGKNSLIFFTALLTFGLLYSFFYGIFVIPVFNIGFYKMTPNTIFDYFYIATASVLSAVIVTLVRYTQLKKGVAGKGVSTAGLFTGAFGAICPACLGVNFLALGNVFSIPLFFLVPYLRWIQVAGLFLLTFGVWLTMRNAYEKICVTCKISTSKTKEEFFLDAPLQPKHGIILVSLLLIATLSLAYQSLPLVGAFTLSSNTDLSSSKVDINKITMQVLPTEGFTIDAIWGDSISKMINAGVLDIDKLDNILTKRYGQPLTEEQRKLLTSGYSEEKLTINAENAVFMMYLLWTLGKHNDNPILHDSPFAKYFENYDIGVGKAGYGDTKLITLTPEQQELATYVAMNSWRPCCNNPTGRPDCSHGFAALGLVELMASQGFSKEEIFDAFVKFNSFWFPSTYIQNAIYFQLTEGKSWDQVDKELVAGKDFSSLSGSYAVKNYLKGLGI